MSKQILSLEELQNIISNIDPIYVSYKKTGVFSLYDTCIAKENIAITMKFPCHDIDCPNTFVDIKIADSEISETFLYNVNYFDLTRPLLKDKQSSLRNAILSTFNEEIKSSYLL